MNFFFISCYFFPINECPGLCRQKSNTGFCNNGFIIFGTKVSKSQVGFGFGSGIKKVGFLPGFGFSGTRLHHYSGKAFDITLWSSSNDQPNNGKDGDPFAILCGNQPYDYEIFDIYTTPWDFHKSYYSNTSVYPLCQI